jgi:hypothetical protein
MLPVGAGNVYSYDDRRNVDGSGVDRTPLPLNLLSMIISYVRLPPLKATPSVSVAQAIAQREY